MEHSLDLAVVWALYGTYMCYQFWPMPGGACSDQQHLTSIKWPKRAHPGALTDAGQERTPWLTSWARATFEQGCLSVLPHLEGPCKAISLPGEHLFQASRIAPDRMRPVIFHAFGKAKLDAHDQLALLARLGWETLPIALLACRTTHWECWETLGYGRAATLYRRTQVVLEASRQVPAHRRVPHAAFLSGLWWKLLSFQPERILKCLPYLACVGNSTEVARLHTPTKFHVEGFSAGSYTGATFVIALCTLFPECPVSATLGALAMPKGIMGALMERLAIATFT